MARRFGASNTDLVESAASFSGSTINVPADRDFTAFLLMKRTGTSNFPVYLAVARGTSDGWHIGADGTNGFQWAVVARGVAGILSGLSIPLNTTVALAVRWDIGTEVTYWQHPEGGSVSGGTPISSATTPNTPSLASEVKIAIGNTTSSAGQSLSADGDIQFAGIVEGLLTDQQVTDTLTALLSGDMAALAGFDERFQMHLSPGGVATDPEDDTSPNNQDSATITGTSAVADLIAASGGGASGNPWHAFAQQ